MSLLRYFHPVLKTSLLKKAPVGAQVGNERIVLYRNAEGRPVALKDRCPHRFTPLSAGKVRSDGRIVCPYHGWNFDGEGKGSKPGRAEGAVSCRVQSYKVAEKYGFLWVGDQTADEDQIADHGGEGWVHLESYSFDFDAPLELVLDNFSEDEHFPFVHKIFGWDESQVNEVDYSCSREGESVNVRYWGPQRNFFGMSFMLARPGQYLHNEWVQKYDPVRITYTAHLTGKNKIIESPGYNRVAIYFVPIGPLSTRLHVFQFIKFRNPFWYKILPFIKPAYVALVKNDLKNDADLMKKLKNVPIELKGMALGRYDEPLRYNRELLDKVYYGRQEAAHSKHQLQEPSSSLSESAGLGAGAPSFFG